MSDNGTHRDTDDNAYEGPDVEVPTSEADADGTREPGGLGSDGTIPADPDGVAAGHTGTASTFEPEEDEQAR
ncbi:hypothetical protein [Microbacterium radiodurans]|uniref:Uncharacterized protein n=1 Tax=Microbacterium radiodurans TaxID=661398 RepID=A0A5J5IYU5_9MICO|nr:hypothetical protein [Microbacterium radiodurans]KAA9089902.1 hypothetical protein F6B42_05525 [Microbacterium radiodurans]